MKPQERNAPPRSFSALPCAKPRLLVCNQTGLCPMRPGDPAKAGALPIVHRARASPPLPSFFGGQLDESKRVLHQVEQMYRAADQYGVQVGRWAAVN